jgi:hypothetical protein
LDKCVAAIEGVAERIPEAWQPTYAAFFRLGNAPFCIATNFRFPRYATKNEFKQLMLEVRRDYIKEKAAFVARSESAFVNKMASLGIDEIAKDDEYKRRLIYDLQLHNGLREPETSEMRIIGSVYNLRAGKWGLPCVKCEYLHRAYDLYRDGPRCERWLRRFPAMNCAESLAVAILHDAWNALPKPGALLL